MHGNLLRVRLRIVLGLSLCFGVLTAASAHQLPGADKQDQPQIEYGRYIEAVARANDLAGSIQSEADAKAYLAEIIVLFPKEFDLLPTDDSRLGRLAHSEYESANDTAKLIPEKQVADVWNEYVREVGMPADAIATPAEIHKIRDNGFTAAQRAWAAGNATRWNIQNGYARAPDGKVAAGCRALEALLVIYNLGDPYSLKAAREQIRKGVVQSNTKSDATNSRCSFACSINSSRRDAWRNRACAVCSAKSGSVSVMEMTEQR